MAQASASQLPHRQSYQQYTNGNYTNGGNAQSYSSSTSYSGSPESSRSSRSQLSGKGGLSGHSTPMHMVNGYRQADQAVTYTAGSDPTHDGIILGSRVNGIQKKTSQPLTRARTELDLAHDTALRTQQNVREQNWEIRHGFEDQYDSTEYMQLLQSVCVAMNECHDPRADHLTDI